MTVGDANFLGTGDIARVSVTYGQYVRGFDLSFTDPYALGPRLSLGVDLFGKETLAGSYQSFDSTVYGAKVSLGAPLTEELGMQWNYSIYNQSVSLDPAVGPSSLPIVQAAQAGPMWVSSVGTGITYSTLDNPKNPTSGVRVQTNNEFAGLGGAAKFARTTEDARYYHEIFGDVVGMARAQTGYATPWGGQPLPLLNGFFGGPQLVRGFAPNGFGPRDITPGTTQDNVGGNVYWTTTAELQTPMPLVSADAKLKVALFADAGSLWATQRIERRKPRLLAVAVAADRQFARDPRVGRRRPDLGFAVRRAPRRLRLPGRQAELRRHPAAEFFRGHVLTRHRRHSARAATARRAWRHAASRCAPPRRPHELASQPSARIIFSSETAARSCSTLATVRAPSSIVTENLKRLRSRCSKAALITSSAPTLLGPR